MTSVVIRPRDGASFRDARSWYTASGGAAMSHDFPPPQAVLGMLRSWWGRDREDAEGKTWPDREWLERTKEIRLGAALPVVRELSKGSWQDGLRWPNPADALFLRGERYPTRLIPRPPPAGLRLSAPLVEGEARLFDGQAPLWFAPPPGHAKAAPAPRWWTQTTFVRWLTEGRLVKPNETPVVRSRPVDHTRTQTAIDTATGGAAEEQLFSQQVFEPFALESDDPSPGRTALREWAFAVDATLPNLPSLTVGRVGGDGRPADFESVDDLFGVPAGLSESLRSSAVPALRVVVISPTVFPKAGFRPEAGPVRFRTRAGAALELDLVLRCAMVPRPMHLTPFDGVGRQALPTVRAVPPGAVYFFERKDGSPFEPEELEGLWLSSWGERTDEGLGRVVAGRWTPSPDHTESTES